jgi:Synaptobrevin
LSEACGGVGDQKIAQIEYELQEIAEDVKRNIGQIFERGEKFETLASKSEQLKSSVSEMKTG